MKKNYCYIDINIKTMKITDHGITAHATLTGETDDINVHRLFLTKGQYNKLLNKLG